MTTEPITLDESRVLIDLEKLIEQGRRTFEIVGLALATIRDRRLYRSDHATFDDYCKSKWGFTKSYCNYLIDGAKIVQSLPKKLATIVATESQARELGKVPEPDRPKVLKAASAIAESENRPLLARDIKDAAWAESLPADQTPSVTLEAQWRDALPKSMLPEQTDIQAADHDLNIICEEKSTTLQTAEDLGRFSLSLSVWAKKFTAMKNVKLSA